jgi:diguanylate cyclase (GGDEF)-like protein
VGGQERERRTAKTLTTLLRAWPRAEEPTGALASVADAARESLEVDRVAVWKVDGDALVGAHISTRDDVPRDGRLRVGRALAPAYFAAFEASDRVEVDDVARDPRTRALTRIEGATLGGASLDVAIRSHGRLVGVLRHESRGPRIFDERDHAQADVNARLAALAIDLGEREAADIALREAHEIERAILEASTEGIVATDERGTILAHNQRFLDLWGVDAAWLAIPTLDARLDELARKTTSPASFVADVRALVSGLRRDLPSTVAEVALADGRLLERTSCALTLPGRHGHVFTYRDVTQERRATERLRANEARLAEIARSDGLTGLLNRGAVLEQLEGLLRLGSRRSDDGPIAVLMMDLDHFKVVNDEHGHLAGDTVLRHFADVLRARLRRGDVVGRYGGEEFVAGLRVADRAAARAAAEAIRQRSREGAEGVVPYSVSIGVAIAGEDGNTLDVLLRAADARLYEAKRAGRDRVVG